MQKRLNCFVWLGLLFVLPGRDEPVRAKILLSII